MVCNLILTQLERHPQKTNKSGRRPKKMEDDLKKNGGSGKRPQKNIKKWKMTSKKMYQSKLYQQLSSTEFDVRLHSYPMIHPTTNTNSTCIFT